MKKIFIIAIAALLIQCAGKKVSEQITSVEGTWKLIELTDFAGSLKGNKGNPMLTIDLKENRYSGHTGCNSYNGKVTYSETKMVFLPGMMTKMACMDNGLESAYMNVIENFTGYQLNGNNLILTKNSTVVARFVYDTQSED